jgi:hypothetical protein
MTIFPILLGALFVFQTEPAALADDALVDRFMAVVPADREPREGPDAAIVAALEAANPGREAEVRRLMEMEAACVAPIQAELSRTTLREIARSLGDETLGRLVAFYESADFERTRALTEREGGERALSESERAELASIARNYPFEEFNQAVMSRSADLFAGHPLFDKMTICNTRRMRAMEEADLNLAPGMP